MQTLFDKPIAPPDAALNVTVVDGDRLRLGRQSRAIYEALRAGPVDVHWLKGIAAQYNARLHELRAWLRPTGWTVDLIEQRDDGNNLYKLVPYAGSREQARQIVSRSRALVGG